MTEPDPQVLTLSRTGIPVDGPTKVSFHTSGVVQFRQDSGDHLPRRQSFRLDGPEGRLFDFRAYGLHGFQRCDLSSATKDYRVRLRFREHPESLIVTAHWWTKSAILQGAETVPIGPELTRVNKRDGGADHAVLIGAPVKFAHRKHLIVLSAQRIGGASGTDAPVAVFLGAWDRHDEGAPATDRMFAFMYPYAGP